MHFADQGPAHVPKLKLSQFSVNSIETLFSEGKKTEMIC